MHLTGSTALGLLSILLPTAGRPFALVWPLAMAAAVLWTVRPRLESRAKALVATFVGILPGLVLLGATHDLLTGEPALFVSALLLLLFWTAASLTLGCGVAERIQGRQSIVEVGSRLLSVAAVTGWIAGALIRLLLPRSTTSGRLAWILGEEDNAQIVGIAREVLVGGPRGAELADQFGTAFVNLPLAVLQLFGGAPSGETDVRMQAITVFTVSTIVAIILAGIAIALMTAIPHHVHRGPRDRPIGAIGVVAGALGSGLAALIGFSFLVVLPMRTGFLTFTWGLLLVLIGVALVLITPQDAPMPTRVMLVVLLSALVVLLFSSWPFIIPALAPLLLVPMLWVRWAALRVSMRRHAARWIIGAALALGMFAVFAFWFSRWGPAAEVLSYGLDILLVGASGIEADGPGQRAAWLSTALAASLAIALSGRGSRIPSALGILGPVAGGGLLYLGLWSAAALLTGGELNYSGIKLLYGVVTIALVIGLTALVSQSTRLGTKGTVLVLLAVVLVHQTSATASLHTTWWDRTSLGAQPHADASIEAIRGTSPDVPIRCLPSPGTRVTSSSQWAAYTCARWMEDAFNEGRFHGHRFDLLRAGGETFEATLDNILSESSSEYFFAYRFTMGPGWFGWTGGG